MIHNYIHKITLLFCDYKNVKENVLFTVTAGITRGAGRPSFSLGGGRSSGDGDGDGVRIMLERRRGVDGRGRGGGGRGGGG